MLSLQSFASANSFSAVRLATLKSFPNEYYLHLSASPSGAIVHLNGQEEPCCVNCGNSLTLYGERVHGSVYLLEFSQTADRLRCLTEFYAFLKATDRSKLLALATECQGVDIISSYIVLPPIEPPSVTTRAIDMEDLQGPKYQCVIEPIPGIASFPPLNLCDIEGSAVAISPLKLDFPCNGCVADRVGNLLIVDYFDEQRGQYAVFNPVLFNRLMHFESSLRHCSAAETQMLGVQMTTAWKWRFRQNDIVQISRLPSAGFKEFTPDNLLKEHFTVVKVLTAKQMVMFKSTTTHQILWTKLRLVRWRPEEAS